MDEEQFLPPEPPDPFTGRDPELQRLSREIPNSDFRSGRPRHIGVTGPAGIGKTAFVAKAVSVPRISHIISLASESQGDDSGFFNPSSADLSRNQAIWIPAGRFATNDKALSEALRNRIGQMPTRSTVVLDGMDVLTPKQQERAISVITNYKRVRAVVTTGRNAPKYPVDHHLELKGLSDSDSEFLLGNFSPQILNPEEIERILALANGHPLTLNTFLEFAKSHGSSEVRNMLGGQLYGVKEPVSDNLITVATPIIVSANETMVSMLKQNPSDVFKLSPRQYEELIAELLRDMGHQVTLTQATRDGGKDILASIETELGPFLCLVEAKRYRQDRTIGVSLVRSLYGTLCDYQANSAMLATTSTFSRDAREFQKRHKYQLSLKDYTDVAGWIQSYGTRK